MSTNNFNTEFDRFKGQLDKDEHDLKEAQDKLRQTEEEIKTLRITIDESKKKLSQDENQQREFKRQVEKLHQDQIRHHAEVERLSRSNRERL